MNKLLCCFTAFIGAIAGCVFTLVAVVKVFGGDIRGFTESTFYLLQKDVKTLTPLDALRIDRLVEKNLIFSSDDLLGQIGTFYSTIIVVLIALITVMSIFTYFFVKGSAEEKAELQAKVVAKQVVEQQINPKIDQIDKTLANIDEQALNKKIETLLEIKLFDSVSFWEKMDTSIYKKTEEAFEDSSLLESKAQFREELDQHEKSINNISSSIQSINQSIESIENKSQNNDDTVIDLGTGTDRHNGN